MEILSRIMGSTGLGPTDFQQMAKDLFNVFVGARVSFLKDVVSDICTAVSIEAGTVLEVEGMVCADHDRYSWWVYLVDCNKIEAEPRAITVAQLFESTTIRHWLASEGKTDFAAKYFPRYM